MLNYKSGMLSKTAIRRFRSMFGASPLVCEKLWAKLPQDKKSN